MPSLYLVTNRENVYAYRCSSGLVFPGLGSEIVPERALSWLCVSESSKLGPAGFFWENQRKVSVYHCPINDGQAITAQVLMSPESLEAAWDKAVGAAKIGLQLIIDPNFLDSLSRDIELYVLDRIVDGGEVRVNDLSEELGLAVKVTQRGLDEMESKNLISFWTRERVYRPTNDGVRYLNQHGWTPENKSSDVKGLPVVIHTDGHRDNPNKYEYDTVTKEVTVAPIIKEAATDRPSLKDRGGLIQNIAHFESLGFPLYTEKGKVSVVPSLARMYGVSPTGILYQIKKLADIGLLPMRTSPAKGTGGQSKARRAKNNQDLRSSNANQ